MTTTRIPLQVDISKGRDSLSKIVKIVHCLSQNHNDDDNDDSVSSDLIVSLVSICRIYDEVMDSTNVFTSFTSIHRCTSATSFQDDHLLWLRCTFDECLDSLPVDTIIGGKEWNGAENQKNKVVGLKGILDLQGDLYRAILGISWYLLRHLPSNVENIHRTKLTIRKTARKLTILQRLLSLIYFLCSGCEEMPSSHSILQDWVDEQQQRQRYTNHSNDNDDNDDNDVENDSMDDDDIITFDREALEGEQDELVQMALTPTPYETTTGQGGDATTEMEMPLIGQLIESATNDFSKRLPMQVVLNHRGILCGNHSTCNKLWAITADSKAVINKDGETCTISPVVTIENTEAGWTEAKLSTSTLDIKVGNRGYHWWGAVSKIAQQLQEIRELQSSLLDDMKGEKEPFTGK